MQNKKDIKIAIIGLGYVGLPLAIEFGKVFDVVGFDIDVSRISELNECEDRTQEITSSEIQLSEKCMFTNDEQNLIGSDFFIVTVPTPLDNFNRPDLTSLIDASNLVGRYIGINGIVVYESTGFPGLTEEVCVPLLEKASGFRLNQDFSVGYSPERINPGDKVHTLKNIIKVTSGSNLEAAKKIDLLYNKIICAGTFMAESIKVAEAAKVIENIQRDINIALINELATLFDKLNIDTESVLETARTKWNFLKFSPGLVGGHCIGIDPYYLTYKAQEVGHNPELILSGRRTNDNMSKFVASRLIKEMAKKDHKIYGAHILVIGFTFKENCPDVRNTKVHDLVQELEDFGLNIDVMDSWADPILVKNKFGIELTSQFKSNTYSAIIVAVGHNDVRELKIETLRDLMIPGGVIYDLKHIFERNSVDIRL
jgi:UDP-N-acetyl-D-glucosamine/UDP-N-acetyl-D-galactosamine dehydrogenase